MYFVSDCNFWDVSLSFYTLLRLFKCTYFQIKIYFIDDNWICLCVFFLYIVLHELCYTWIKKGYIISNLFLVRLSTIAFQHTPSTTDYVPNICPCNFSEQQCTILDMHPKRCGKIIWSDYRMTEWCISCWPFWMTLRILLLLIHSPLFSGRGRHHDSLRLDQQAIQEFSNPKLSKICSGIFPFTSIYHTQRQASKSQPLQES